MEISSSIDNMRNLLRLEEEAQEKKFFESNVPIKELRKEGIVIFPIRIKSKSFGFTDQPIIQIGFSGEVNRQFFSGGTPITLFTTGENEVCNGILFSLSEHEAEILLYSEEFPDWIDEKNVGIKRLPDNRSFQLMHSVLKRIEKGENRNFTRLFQWLHGVQPLPENHFQNTIEIDDRFQLNDFQKEAVRKGATEIPIQIIHGPPGTGKTTTISALISVLSKQGKSIIASAPSNAAIDHLALQLIKNGLKVLRLGNTAKVNQLVWEHTPEGILSQDKFSKQIKKLRIQAEEYRKMAHQYKRNFGKAEREQRNLLFKEVRAIREEIKAQTEYFLSKYFDEADVILGTPVGLRDSMLNDKTFDVAFIDEAGQCLEPLAWLVMEKAERIVLSGDHFQLPPTIISEEAAQLGLSTSVLERAINSGISHFLLRIQYRMTPEICGFSSAYFYDGKLKSNKTTLPDSLLFFDTAGAGFEEKRDLEFYSYSNLEEIQVVLNRSENWILPHQSAVFISPYSAQVELAKKHLKDIKISTIDSFQGQEADVVIISLVRSNSEGKIGFLSDYRRMNVALTRAREKLIVIGDSSTLSKDKFYEQFVQYTEEIGAYRSVFELLY